MKVLIKNELERALKNKWFYITLLFSTIVILYDIWDRIIPIRKSMDMYIIPSIYPIPTVYSRWMEFWSPSSSLLHFIFPLLACIPYAMTIYTDAESKYMYNIIVRTDKKKYFLSKLITQFVTGFLVVLYPLATSFAFTAAILPFGVPFPITNFPFGPLNVLTQFFYKYPFLTCIIMMILEAVFFGLISCLAYTFAYLLKNGVMVVISAFIIFFFESVFSPLIGIRSTLVNCSFLSHLNKSKSVYMLVTMVVIILVLGITYYLRSNAKDEL